ncbi:helix-turn-helix transcriptional regulator [Ruminococcus flavefaciens]|uniref:helix-turn-helix domain-containing protein n=1 Tax=Ruminococcus flavefaciens TaxID=1265 RepID=UPI0026EC947F|nr:helix-turn-helix transcriptional regulator [Ruminococcus flavefaciens]
MNQTEFKVAQIRANITKEEIAKRLNINIATLYRKFNGESDFTLSELKALKEILGLSKEDVDRIFFSD